MSDIDIIKKQVDQWLKHIDEKNLSQTFSKDNIDESSIITYSPYHFAHREGNKIFLNCDDMVIYKQIYSSPFFNKGLSTQLKEGSISKMFLHKLLKKNQYKILGINSSEAKKYRERNKTIELNLDNTFKKSEINLEKKKEVFHINDVWSVMDSKPFQEVELDEYQEKASKMVMENQLSVISGYAGTGKSLTIQEISRRLENKGWNISRIAPTGRASQIIKGRTIHSWLEPIVVEKAGGKIEILGFSKDRIDEMECVIVDESSMINYEIWNEVMRVWNNSQSLTNKKLVFVGDPGQLEPIGDGKPFIELLEDQNSPHTQLKNIHRSKTGNGIIDMSSFVRHKGYLDVWNKYSNVKFISKTEAIEMVARNTDIQMITPRRNSSEGSLDLNIKIKEKMNVDKPAEFFTLVWDEKTRKYQNHSPVNLNDKVIIVKNLWEWNITNGTTGIYKGKFKKRIHNHVKNSITNKRPFYKFLNPETKREFYLPANTKTRSQMELAYAITIHKAQGSEYKTPILYFSKRWIEPKMLYTAITRAKEFIYIYYPEKEKEAFSNFII